MKIAGIICEYNPLHRGHEYQLQKTRQQTGADVIVCAMSGACVQRGDIAIIDKWTRAKMALSCGADVVFELPALFAVRPARDFAMGGVSLLSAAGAHAISFGSEISDISLLKAAAAVDMDENFHVKEALRKGFSYPRAAQEAYKDLGISPDLADMPNMILGVEYIRAIEKIAPETQPVAIKRDRGDGLSATLLRSLLIEGEKDAALAMLPPHIMPLLEGKNYNSFVNVQQAVLYSLRNAKREELLNIPGVSEGLEVRIMKAALSCATLNELFADIKSKRYTMARIRRAVLSHMLGITGELCAKYPSAPYLRILGFKKSALPYLAALRDFATIPIINKFADAQMNECIEIDLAAQNLFDLGLGIPTGADFKTSPVIL
ncbi:MAG: nucleotidyltransferase family protein [Christensenellales bacterium]|jgi:predicted nucleotidyltransferase